MAERLIECPHCHGEKICKADHGRSCEVCKTAAGVGRRGRPTPVRCSYCSGHGRIWASEERIAQIQAEEEALAAEVEAAVSPPEATEGSEEESVEQ